VVGGEPAGIHVVPRNQWGEREYLMASAGVSYVALTMKAVEFDDPLAPAQDLLSHILRTGPLWEKIRMQGGAYGAFASSRTTEGLFSFGSYRDPNTVKTLEAYRTALTELAEDRIEDTQVDLAKVSVLGRELKPLTPRDSAFTNFRRRLHDIDDALRQETRDRLRAVTPADLQAIAGELVSRLDQSRIVILGGSAGLEEWSQALNGAAREIPVYQVGV
jgi:Zn-dependent M16 (insulinase) family peptidase